MTNYVSFSIWGNDPLYNVGIVRNSELMNDIYPDWKMIVYYNDSVPKETLEKLQINNCVLKKIDDFDYGWFWRFFAADLDDCRYVCFRDADSRISKREKLAVDEWVESKKSLHVMRDHPYHGIPAGNNKLGILAGMWGIKGKELPMTEMIKKFVVGKEKKYGIDQTFLKVIYSIFENNKITHDEFFEKKPFPSLRENGRFVGERIGPDGNPVNQDYKLLL